MKKKHLFHKMLAWIERLNDYPGCDRKELTVRVQMWFGTAYALLHVVLLTIAFLIFAPEALKVLIGYGYFLAIVLITSLFVTPRIKRQIKLTYFIQLIILLMGTLITILHLGGIATSGGLIVVCLALMLCTVPLQDSRISLASFLLFTFIVIISGLFISFFSVPASLTPKVNSILFMINTLSMSGLALFLILSFIAQQRKLESLESEKLKEVNEARNKLFTNITHEFRTPLTVIQGMADLIEKFPEQWLSSGTQKIRDNSNILLNLVNQMLDFAKIEAGAMPLNNVQGNINAYLGYVTELFGSLAQNHGIQLICIKTDNPFIMDFDPDKLLHVVSNLLSNAIKFTPEGGIIEVSTSIEERRNWFSIQVKDKGIGISEEFLPHVFDRFFHVDHASHFQQGTGLGLSMAKELTELMKGQIHVESRPGHGTVFTVLLPVTNEAAFEDMTGVQVEPEIIRNSMPISKKTLPAAQGQAPDRQNLPVLLIVEDSDDVSNYLSAILKTEYRIEHAENGKIGLEKAISQIPDIVLSDVMMPEMDGISLLEKIKNDMHTSHIPVVMLTAKADVSSRLEGLERGADAYLAKPFDERELHIVLKNLVEIRMKLQERYSSPEKFPPPADVEFQKEDEFMLKVRHILEINLDDEDFGITDLCRELAVSHTQLYRKFRSLSNKTISEYLKSMRLHQAKILLSGSGMNVTEVAFSTGFKNLSHFSREFSTAFGTSPNDFRKNPDLGHTANN